MPCLGDVTEEEESVVASAATDGVDAEGVGEEDADESVDGNAGEDTGKRRRQPSQKMIEAMGMLKRKIPESPTQGETMMMYKDIEGKLFYFHRFV